MLGALAAALGLGGAAPSPALPAGWREPTGAERADLLRQARRSTAEPTLEQKLSVSGDFDGDGKTDRAAFLLNDRRGAFRLFVRRGATGRYEPLNYSEKITALGGYGLEVEPPGTYADILDEDAKPVRTRWPAVGAAYFESSYVIFYWDGRRFGEIWLSD